MRKYLTHSLKKNSIRVLMLIFQTSKENENWFKESDGLKNQECIHRVGPIKGRETFCSFCAGWEVDDAIYI